MNLKISIAAVNKPLLFEFRDYNGFSHRSINVVEGGAGYCIIPLDLVDRDCSVFQEVIRTKMDGFNSRCRFFVGVDRKVCVFRRYGRFEVLLWQDLRSFIYDTPGDEITMASFLGTRFLEGIGGVSWI